MTENVKKTETYTLSIEALRTETYNLYVEVMRIADQAFRQAQEESRKANVPNVYSQNGKLYYSIPEPTAS